MIDLRVSIAMAGLMLMSFGCATSDVRIGTRSDPDVDFKSYGSFAWVGAPQAQRWRTFISSASLEKLEAAIVEELQRKGYVLADRADADFLVSYRVDTEERPDFRTYPTEELGYWGRKEPYQDESRRTYVEGTLVIEIVDPLTMAILWEGWFTREITGEDRSDPGGTAYRAAGALLQKFPP
ncbi:MAG: DUF4136 domain-containing protein [Pseudomonadales bacterium]